MAILKKIFFLISIINFLLLNTTLFSQEVPHSVTNTGIYNFLDELATNHIITINSVVKPYSRLFIANRLQEAEEKRELLTTRQQKELDFYMMDFGKEMVNGSTAKRQNGAKATWIKGGTVQRSDGTTVKLRRDLFYYRDSLFSSDCESYSGW